MIPTPEEPTARELAHRAEELVRQAERSLEAAADPTERDVLEQQRSDWRRSSGLALLIERRNSGGN
jgi:hypothetical protein